MDRNFFTGVKIEEIKLSTGARIGLPVYAPRVQSMLHPAGERLSL